MAEEWFDAGAALPGLRGTAVHVLPPLREKEARAVLRVAAFRIREIEGGQVRDEPSFFDEAARAFRWPAHFGRNWDAFQDALGDLAEGEDRRVPFSGATPGRASTPIPRRWWTLSWPWPGRRMTWGAKIHPPSSRSSC